MWLVLVLGLAAACGPVSRPEQCDNGEDDDLDGATDCADAECSASCGDSCERAIPVQYGTAVTGSTRGRDNVVDAYCTDEPSGPDAFYRVEAPFDGRFRVRLTSSAPLMLVLMDHCDDEEVACAGPTPIDASGPMRTGDVRYLVVTGRGAQDEGDFALSFERSLCGNGVRDNPDEACDGTDFGGQTCVDFELSSGTLRCTADCRVDSSGCQGGD